MEEVKTIKAEREVIETTLRDPVADIGKREKEGRREKGGRDGGMGEMGPWTTRTEGRARSSRSPWSKEWWGGLHKVGESQLPKCDWN